MTACEMAKTVLERYDAKPYAFSFSTSIVADPVDDGRGGKLKVEPRRVAQSDNHFITGELFTYDDMVLRNKATVGNDTTNRRRGEFDILLSNMRGNDNPVIIENKNSWLFTGAFGEKDVIVDWAGQIIRRGDESELVHYRAKMIAAHKAELDAYDKATSA